MWMIGDWLAYGQEEYLGKPGHERLKNDTYAKVAEDTGYAESTLRDATWVCTAIPLSRRRDKLTYTHAKEIVGRTTPGQYEFWIARAIQPGVSAKQLREELRKAKAIYKPEPRDIGVKSSLFITDQYVREMLVLGPSEFRLALKQAHLRNLKPVLDALGG
jgi:hypothetical protein